MKGHTHVSRHRIAGPLLAGGLLAALLPGVVAARAEPLSAVPSCEAVGPGADGRLVEPWSVELDAEGVVAEHRITFEREGARTTLRTGPRGFSLLLGSGRVLVGERSDAGTDLAMIDIPRACRLWTRHVDRLAYPYADGGDRRQLRLSLHRPDTRRFEGDLTLDVESGDSDGMIDGICLSECEPHDGDLSLAAYEPAGAARPVPSFAAGGWPQGKKLTFRWGPGAVPPGWAAGPLTSAAGDVARTSAADGPRFVHRDDATNKISYTGTFPAYCSRSGIACAARNMPSYWGVWLRPHGTDFAWGTLRWCQKSDAAGCFDIRRVTLHELGHVSGLHHPSSAGFTLAGQETVMHAITPAKPRPGSTRHAFGRCDVATLQELYDTPDNKTAISTCNDVATVLHLSSSRSLIDRGDPVRLIAELRIEDRAAYRELAGNPLNGRLLKLKYRRAGSADAWQASWMRSLYSSGRYELVITPDVTWEFKAAFPAPSDEGLRYSRSEIVEVRVRD